MIQFLLVLDWVMRKMTVEPNGIQWSIATRLEDLDSADDIRLFYEYRRIYGGQIESTDSLW